MGDQLNRTYVFISYSRADCRFAKRLVSALETAGVGLWIDDQQLKAGDSLLSRIQSAIDRASFFVALLSPNSVNSRWVQEELQIAMSLQLNGYERFVIPIVLEACDIPGFLRHRLYLDFTNKRKFKDNVAKLLHAIDSELSHHVSPHQTHHKPTSQSYFEQIAADEAISADPWFEEFKDMALTQDLLRAVALGSFGGQFRRDLRLALAFTSNLPDARNLNNLLALLGFCTDISHLIAERHDLRLLMRDIISDISISTDYRWFALSKYLSALKDVRARLDRLATLPTLFPDSGLEPLSTRLVSEFFQNETTLFEQLWGLASTHYREDMVQYTKRIGKWRTPLQISDQVCLRDNCRTALANAFPKWDGVSLREPQENDIAQINERIANQLQHNSIDDIVDSFIVLSASTKLSVMNGMIFDRQFWNDLTTVRGKPFVFNLQVAIVSSPYVQSLVSAMCFLCLAVDGGIDGLRYHDAFPSSLMRTKEQGLYRDFSVIIAMIDQLSMDEKDVGVLVILAEVIRLFPADPLLAYIAIAIKKYESPNRALKLLLGRVYGDISQGDLAKRVEELR